jgi:hypothetical protein
VRTALAVDDSPDLDNTFSRTKKKGAKLTLPGVQAKALSVIVTKCKAAA